MKDAGFTLLELLVAVVLLGLVGLTLSGGIRIGVRAWERSADLGQGAERIAAVQAVLRRQLERAYPLSDLRRPDRAIVFAGDADRIDFRAPGPQPLGLGALQAASLERQGDRLTLAWADAAAAVHRETLLDGVRSLQIDYYGSRDRQEARAWRDSWQDAFFLPGLIRIEVAFRDESRRWPTLVIAPALTVDYLKD